MSEVMRIQPFEVQLQRLRLEFERHQSVFGIPAALFHRPVPDAPYVVSDLFGRPLATPFGPSAGPHTQLSQNIVSAWLCGGRFIELKTVQVNDRLVIPRPSIDMTDEGYNVEWSQELLLDQSAHEYAVAWALVHLLPRVLGWDAERSPVPAGPGAIFDMSVGYDLEGIRSPRMARFMDLMADASERLESFARAITRHLPQAADVEIPTRIATSVTLSTMHGCPPGEIARIARYLIEERGLHTVVKLNPTLLGRDRVRDILHDRLGFTGIDLPEAAFEHDLTYHGAVELITTLKAAARARGLTFGVKLSNTLPVRPRDRRLPGEDHYLSGRALYPVTMALFDALLHEFDGDLSVSYSAGADALNASTILSCGALPVTACTDLLKPGGYTRMIQWIEQLGAAMTARGTGSLAEFSRDRLVHVRRAAAEALEHPRYRKTSCRHGLPKAPTRLGAWDCVVAPCQTACAVDQQVPDYAWHLAHGDPDRALEAILARNPLPGITGYVCTRLCETRCTRRDYDESVAIRALKRAAADRGRAGFGAPVRPPTGRAVAVVGSGPSGLAASAFLAVNGVAVTVFEARDVVGGMMRLVPPFRLPQAVIDRDVERIVALGVTIRLGTPVTGPPEALLAQGFDAVYLASGFQRDAPLQVPGAEGPAVVSALRLLDASRRGAAVALGRTVVVVGGGDTAMDAARTAQRLTGAPATIVYRRTRREMPAAPEELQGALEEGHAVEELATPVEVVRREGSVVGLRCRRTELGEPGPDGRPAPIEIPGSEFVIPCESVVVALGQLPDLAFLDGSGVTRHARGGVVVDRTTRSAGPDGVYAGGDVVVEPGSIIAACQDGRLAAEAICRRLGLAFAPPPARPTSLSEDEVVTVKAVRARRLTRAEPDVIPATARAGFHVIESPLSEPDTRAEALRCVQCAAFCDKCVEVCPNRANLTFRVSPVCWALPVLTASAGRLRVTGVEEFRIAQDRQIVHVDDFCNECDNCQTFCVHHGRPYRDKPRLFLDPVGFAAESDNAFHIAGSSISRRDGGRESRLAASVHGWHYQAGPLDLSVTRDWQIVEIGAAACPDVPVSLRPAAEMAVLFEGIRRSLPFLLIT